MKMCIQTGIICALLCITLPGSSQTPPPPAKPDKEHALLRKFVGEWSADALKMTASTKLIGSIWTVWEIRFDPAQKPPTGIFTLGYDPQKKRYVGTWIDSMQKNLWVYEGTLDASGKVLTLDTEGPSMEGPGKMAKMQDIYEFKSDSHVVLTSKYLQPNGKWITFQTVNYKRKR